MATLAVSIQIGNASFKPEPGVEVARILRKLAQAVEFDGALPPGNPDPLRLLDYNGNHVGQARWTGVKR